MRKVFLILLLWCSSVMAQELPLQNLPADQPHTRVADTPIGAPYNTAVQGRPISSGAEVSLRDYMSSRLDQTRAELLDRIQIAAEENRQIRDERDRQYDQRFNAQEKAVAAALETQKEATAAALAAASAAVNKAEDAANERFASVNEFRAQLGDQANTFVTKDAAEARDESFQRQLDTLIEKINEDSRRLDNIYSSNEGARGLWIIIAGVVLLIIAIATFIFSVLARIRPPTIARLERE